MKLGIAPIVMDSEELVMTVDERSFEAEVAASDSTISRIALFTDTFAEVNGAAHTLRKVAETVQGLGIGLDVYTYGEENAVEERGSVRILTFDHRLSRTYYERLRFELVPDFRVGETWRRAMREHPYDVVHLATPGSMGLVGRALANRSRRALVGTYHTHLADYGAMRSSAAMRKIIHGLSWEFLRWFYAPCVSVLGPTEGVVEELRRRRFRNQLGVFTRGIDLDLYNVARRQRQDTDVVTSYVGRLAPEKNVRFLPDIVSGTQSPVWIIGDGPERPWLEQKLHRARFTGYLFGEQLANAYADSDLLLFPSTTDTFGNVVLEAMASGVVPIVAKGPGPSDFVQHGENAFICEGPDGMRDAMTRLIRNPELRLNMRHNARRFAERFDWQHAVQQLLQHYRSAAVSR